MLEKDIVAAPKRATVAQGAKKRRHSRFDGLGVRRYHSNALVPLKRVLGALGAICSGTHRRIYNILWLQSSKGQVNARKRHREPNPLLSQDRSRLLRVEDARQHIRNGRSARYHRLHRWALRSIRGKDSVGQADKASKNNDTTHQRRRRHRPRGSLPRRGTRHGGRTARRIITMLQR